jgi:hypothetical protein
VSLPFSEIAGGRTFSHSPTCTTKIIIKGGHGIFWLATLCGIVPEPVSENDGLLMASSGMTKGDDEVRLVEHVCPCFYTILVIADTPLERHSQGLLLHR